MAQLAKYSLTPGYETHRGLRWCGAIIQAAPAAKKR